MEKKAAISKCLHTRTTGVETTTESEHEQAIFSFGCGFLVSLFSNGIVVDTATSFTIMSSGVDTVYINWPMDFQVMGQGDSTLCSIFE